MKGQAQPHQMQLRCVCAAAAQAHPAVGGHLHHGGRPEGNLHLLLPAHGARLALQQSSQHSSWQADMRFPHSAAPPVVLTSPLLPAEGGQAEDQSQVGVGVTGSPSASVILHAKKQCSHDASCLCEHAGHHFHWNPVVLFQGAPSFPCVPVPSEACGENIKLKACLPASVASLACLHANTGA